jgi:CIC family chloride channel protein
MMEPSSDGDTEEEARHDLAGGSAAPLSDTVHAGDSPPLHTRAGATQAQPSSAVVEELRSEIQDFVHTSDQRRRLFPRALLAGAAAGTVAVAFRAALAGGDAARAALLTWAHQFPVFGWLFPALYGAAGAGVAVAMVRRLAPEAAGSGIPHLEAVLRRFRTLDARRVLPVKFLGGVLAIGAGLALGREGPTVQMGASVSDIIAGWLHSGPRERRTLLAAGAGAGLAAAFNAPLAGLVFVLEEVQRDFRPIVFGAAFVAAAAADVVARSATHTQLPVFTVPSYPVPELTALPAFLILGAVAGLFGVLFNKVLLRSLDLFARVPARAAGAAAALVGAIVGLTGWFLPGALGGGHELAETVMAGGIALAAIPLWFVLRFVLTMASYGCGAPGGIFAPLLVLGALIGLAVGDVAHALVPGVVPRPEIFAVVGMAAYFTAVVRAPLTGIVLIVEMTGNYGQMLPLIVACFGAYAVAESVRDLPIYEALLERDLARGGLAHAPSEPIVLELAVEHASAFDGCAVRDLGLPPGAILVSARDETREWVPSGSTVLKAEDRITAVVSPEAANAHALAILREGCSGTGEPTAGRAAE